MLGNGLADDAVGRQNFHHVKTLDDGGGQRVPALARLGAFVAGDVGVGVAVGDDRLQLIGDRTLVEVAAFWVELGVSLGFNRLRDRKQQFSREDGCFRMVCVGSFLRCRHQRCSLSKFRSRGNFKL